MQKAYSELDEIKIVGIKVRTNNEAEFKSENPKIFQCVQKYYHQDLASKIPNRINPGRTFSIYTEYESDHNGEYTYFIGEEVSTFVKLPSELHKLTIPIQRYAKFTTEPGPMPDVVRDAWQKIWTMTDDDLGGARNYWTDFEIYDERANDHENVVLDIFIGIQPEE